MADELTRMIDEALNPPPSSAHGTEAADSRPLLLPLSSHHSSSNNHNNSSGEEGGGEDEEEEAPRLVTAAAVRRALPPSMRISRAAVRALQLGVEAYAAEVWAWARLLSRRGGPRPGTLRLGARLASAKKT
jgi:hypothetical protein